MPNWFVLWAWQRDGAAAVGECFATAHRIEDNNLFESWYAEWAATAGRVEALGENCLKRGHKVSARDAFLRAATYYRNAYFFLRHHDGRKKETWKKGQDSFRNAAKLFDPADRRVGDALREG